MNANGHLILIGGKTATATLDRVSELAADRGRLDSRNVYAHDGANALSPRGVAGARPSSTCRTANRTPST